MYIHTFIHIKIYKFIFLYVESKVCVCVFKRIKKKKSIRKTPFDMHKRLLVIFYTFLHLLYNLYLAYSREIQVKG